MYGVLYTVYIVRYTVYIACTIMCFIDRLFSIFMLLINEILFSYYEVFLTYDVRITGLFYIDYNSN